MAQSSIKGDAGSAGPSVPADRLCVPSDWKLPDHKGTARLETLATEVMSQGTNIAVRLLHFWSWGHCELFPTFRTILVPSSSGLSSLGRIIRIVYPKFFLIGLTLNLKLLRQFETSPGTRRDTAADMTIQTVYQTAWTSVPPLEFYSGTNNLTCEVRI